MPNQTINNISVQSTVASASEVLHQNILPAEMQIVAASLFASVSEAAQIPTVVAAAIKSDRAVQYAVARAGIDVQTLRGKLDALPPVALLAIQHGVTQFMTMSANEMFGPNRLPSLATLGRLGLVKAHGQAAWGFAIVQLADWRTCEFVLRQDPSTTGVDQLPYSLDHACAGIVKLVRSAFDGEVVPKDRHMALRLAGLIALRAGWRNFRVEERNGCAVVEIPREDLLGDFYRGELAGVVLQGINAPEAARV